MPQMAPMWWCTLEISFIVSLIIMMTNIFFNLNIKIKSNQKIKKKEIKWMW
uniref:ATP synthase F0 subunit 8 n=1 Tax=Macropsidius duuschulus TaxID=2479914 RepID=UPI002E76B317|nr:ATP synthase F0 subunit 8 [Macropsidius duuschulus]WRK21469.1 ATP synthase F0 subunit 8 [Macropsidius duuschulus]